MSQSQESFKRLQSYSFEADSEFANGLAIILGHPGTPATEAEMKREDDLVLQAKCFFFSRKEDLSPAIDFTAYKSWLNSQSREPHESTTAADPSSDSNAGSSTAPPQPAYPSSFAHIVDLITSGQPIPGIQQIPDTVLTGHDMSTEKPRRRKPWEKDDPPPSQSETPDNPTELTS